MVVTGASRRCRAWKRHQGVGSCKACNLVYIDSHHELASEKQGGGESTGAVEIHTDMYTIMVPLKAHLLDFT